MDKVASMGFSWKFILHPLLVNYVAWKGWKTLVYGISPASERWIISGYPHPALSQLRVTPVSASICWEREVLLQVGADGRPHLQAFFPSPASVRQVKSETSRWGGESKGWGLRLWFEIVINYAIQRLIIRAFLTLFFWANSLLVILLTQYTSCVHFIAPNHKQDIFILLL